MLNTKTNSAEASKEIVAYKGFNQNLTCRDFQYEIGKTYEHKGSVVRCAAGGFHSCEYPLSVFGYYAPSSSRYATVLASGKIDKEVGGDTKIASGSITVQMEISIPTMVKHAIAWITERLDHSKSQTNTGNRSAASNTGDYSAASNTGDYSAASNTGYYSAASNTGDYSAASNTGDQSAASNTGDQSAASNTGDQSAASNTGDQSAASNTGDQSAASNTGNRSAASNTGDYSAASNTGYYSAASNTGDYSAASNTGDQSAASVEGRHSVALASGERGRAKACSGSAIVLCYRNYESELIHIRSAIAGQGGVKADTWYSLDESGGFVEVE